MGGRKFEALKVAALSITFVGSGVVQAELVQSQQRINQDSTDIGRMASIEMVTPMPKVNTSSTTYNAGTVSWGGKCGASNGSILPSSPTSFLCNSGSASPVVTTGTKYTWSCKGSNGTVTSCSADQRIVGACGSDNGANVTYPTNLCAAGTPSAVSASGNLYSWTCTGNYGPAAVCSAAVVSEPTTAQSITVPWWYGDNAFAHTVSLADGGPRKQLTGTATFTWYPASLGKCSSINGAKYSKYVYGCFDQTGVTYSNLDYNKAMYFDESLNWYVYGYSGVYVDSNCGSYYFNVRTNVSYMASGVSRSTLAGSGYNSVVYDISYSDFSKITHAFKAPVLYNTGCGGS